MRGPWEETYPLISPIKVGVGWLPSKRLGNRCAREDRRLAPTYPAQNPSSLHHSNFLLSKSSAAPQHVGLLVICPPAPPARRGVADGTPGMSIRPYSPGCLSQGSSPSSPRHIVVGGAPMSRWRSPQHKNLSTTGRRRLLSVSPAAHGGGVSTAKPAQLRSEPPRPLSSAMCHSMTIRAPTERSI